MKKTIYLIVSTLTILSLCACNSKLTKIVDADSDIMSESDEEAVQEVVQEEVQSADVETPINPDTVVESVPQDEEGNRGVTYTAPSPKISSVWVQEKNEYGDVYTHFIYYDENGNLDYVVFDGYEWNRNLFFDDEYRIIKEQYLNNGNSDIIESQFEYTYNDYDFKLTEDYLNKDGTEYHYDYPCYYSWDAEDENIVYVENDNHLVKQFVDGRITIYIDNSKVRYYTYNDEEHTLHIESYPLTISSDEEVYVEEDKISEKDIVYDEYGNLKSVSDKPYDKIPTLTTYEYEERKINGNTVSLLTQINTSEYSVFNDNYIPLDTYYFTYDEYGYMQTATCSFKDITDYLRVLNHDFSDVNVNEIKKNVNFVYFYQN